MHSYSQNRLADKSVKAIVAIVVFGTLSLRCRGKGICSIWVNQTFQRGEGKGKAILYRTKRGRIKFEFLKESLSTKTNSELFNSPLFEMQEDYEFSPELENLFGLQKLILKKGKYPIRKSNCKYTITFTEEDLLY